MSASKSVTSVLRKRERERERKRRKEEKKAKALLSVSLLFSQDHVLFSLVPCPRKKLTFDGKKDVGVLRR